MAQAMRVCVSSVPIKELYLFYLYVTAATSLDLRNPPRKAARYLAWKVAITRKSAGHSLSHARTHIHLTSVAVSAGVYRSNLDLPQIMDAR